MKNDPSTKKSGIQHQGQQGHLLIQIAMPKTMGHKQFAWNMRFVQASKPSSSWWQFQRGFKSLYMYKYPPTPALAKAGAAPGTTAGVELLLLSLPRSNPSHSQQAAPRPHRVNILLACFILQFRLPGIWT